MQRNQTHVRAHRRMPADKVNQQNGGCSEVP
jgi:hypothetical protein